ncbi:glycosyltransferase family 8 protein [Ammoniphilus resinae]|uniref:Lipopolysaccharide biosynthesis glycosyltransferase n=1 Tax=Ammoniphilus resinae TaxID=861532 RepID=A0ABS4GRV6_9BACL|nr:glycosyltransferase family 8 protein [Ammoniphilus resinae]MBP1933017.1 lipopolysaccharide biosynthesis glycosyltransferase [Ammoniphilus resinae]
MSRINIVTAADDRYAGYLAVMLFSLLENKSSSMPVTIYIIDSQISLENKTLLNNIIKKFNCEIIYLTLDSTIYENFKTLRHITKETYFRISIPELLDKSIEKTIYLDSDLIVKEDITLLWNHHVDHYFLGAVKDAYLRKSRNSYLSIPKDSDYFNAGVLVLNLKRWREFNITKKIIDFIKNNSEKIVFPSQDPMNAVLHDAWLPLNEKWNYQPYLHKTSPLVKPSIIHYCGSDKPWNSNHPLRHYYIEYAEKVFPSSHFESLLTKKVRKRRRRKRRRRL